MVFVYGALLRACMLAPAALVEAEGLLADAWRPSSYPEPGRAGSLWPADQHLEAGGAGTWSVGGTSQKQPEGAFAYLVHTVAHPKPSWVEELFVAMARPCIFVVGEAPHVRHDLYHMFAKLQKRDDPQQILSGVQYAVFIDADLVQPEQSDIVRFEEFLLEWLPAVGLPFLRPIYGHADWYAARPAWPWAQWDDAMVAYHCLAAPRLFTMATTPGWASLGWAARWRHRVWALLLFPERVLLTPNVQLYRKRGGIIELPDAETLFKTYLEVVAAAKASLEQRFVDRGDTWKVTMLAIPHPMQPYSPIITNGLQGGMPIGCHKCICPMPRRGVPELFASATPTWAEAVTGDVIRLHGLVQKRLHYVFMESELTGGFADVAEDLAARALLPIEAARRHSEADVERARVYFELCMAPSHSSMLMAGDIPDVAMRVRELPVRSRTHLYVLLIPGPSLRGTCWLELLRRDDCWLLIVTWKEPLTEPLEALQNERVTTAYLPRSNIQEAKLSQHWVALEIIVAQGWRFSYVVRGDADACLTWSTALGAEELAALQLAHDSSVGAFHDFLERDLPPVAVVHNVVDASAFSGPFNRSTGPWDLSRPCVLAWDHRFHAVSAEALPFYAFDLALQPLNWNTADVSVLYRLGAAFAGRTVSYTEVELDVRTLKSSSDSYLKVLGDDSVLPTVANSWERTWLPLAHRSALGLPRHLRHRAIYSFWMEWEAGDGASDCLPPLPRHSSHEHLWVGAPTSSTEEVCHAQREPHLRWPWRPGALVLVMMLEQLLTSFLGRLRRLHHHTRDKRFSIAGWDYPGEEVEAAFLREAALHLRVYELVCDDAFDDGAKALNHSRPFSLEARAQLQQISGDQRLPWFSHLRTLEDAAQAFRMEGGKRIDGLPPGGKEPLLMHLQLRATLAALPAHRIAHHDPRSTLPRPTKPQVFFAHPWLIASGQEAADALCRRAEALPSAGAGDERRSLCVVPALPKEWLEADARSRAAAMFNGTEAEAEASRRPGSVATLLGLLLRGRACSDVLVLPLGPPATLQPLARAAACFRQLVQGFRYTAVLHQL